MLIGYARESTDDQDTAAQVAALKAAGCERMYREKASGGRWDRPELHRLLDHLRKGDVLVVWKLDRLSRSLRDVLTIMEGLAEAKAGFRSLTEAIDTTTPAGRMMMQMVGAFAEFERAMLKERTKAGLDAARQDGRIGGRRPKLSPQQQTRSRRWFQRAARRPPMRRGSSKSIPPPSRGCWRGLTLNSTQSSTPNESQSDKTFGPGKQAIWPGHQITEMALAKLCRATGDARYLALAQLMLEVRGPDGRPGSGRTYNQSHQKVVDQTEAVGQAVRATYMYSGMADVAALTGDERYVKAIDRIWENVAGRKLYLTGGIGAKGSGEAFGADYELPNMTAYNETCAAIGNDYWNFRLFLLHADARYIDVMERTLYNGLISGVALDVRTFFCPNPLESNGQHARSPCFGVACCPGNISRFMASIPGYVYAQRGDALWVNLYMASTATVPLDYGAKVKIVQEAENQPGAEAAVGDPCAHAGLGAKRAGSELYRFSGGESGTVVLKVNRQAAPLTIEKGYVTLTREWAAGDTIDLVLPMPMRRIAANEQVAADRGRVALQRGPLVYAAEWPEFADGKVRNLVLPATAKLTAEARPAMLNGVTVIRGKAQPWPMMRAEPSRGRKSTSRRFRIIPGPIEARAK